MEEIKQEIAETKAAIKQVEAAIDKVERKLEEDDLAKDDVVYWREKEKQLREKEKQLSDIEGLRLKHQSEGGRPPLHPDGGNPELVRKVDQLLQLAIKTDRATPQYSPALIASQEMARLKRKKKIVEFEGRPGEDSVLSVEEVDALSKMENEHQVVAFISPHLENIFRSCEIPFSVFNSEKYKWIETSSETTKYNEKPDLLICHPGIISKKPPFLSKDAKLNQMRNEQCIKYGVLTAWKLRDAIGLACEAKLSIGKWPRKTN